jgi:hypothetical protein
MDELRTKAESYVQKFFSLPFAHLSLFASHFFTILVFNNASLSAASFFAETRFKNITSFLPDVCMHPAPSDTMHTRKAAVVFVVAHTNNKSVHNGIFSQPACHFP